MLAPILVFAYNRPDHLKQTIAYLLKNPLAKSSALYVFSDGAKTDFETEKINEVRDYLRKVSGFADIILEFSEENKGLAKSVIEGVSKVISLHDKVIVLEDDLLVSADFLTFMNNALDFYQNEEKVGSVSGYSFGLELHNLEHSYFFTKRASSWGWGTWKNRWKEVDWDMRGYNKFVKNKKEIDEFNSQEEKWIDPRASIKQMKEIKKLNKKHQDAHANAFSVVIFLIYDDYSRIYWCAYIRILGIRYKYNTRAQHITTSNLPVDETLDVA